MTIAASAIVLMIIGIIGIWNFTSDFRSKKLRWWDYLFVIISVLMVIEGVYALYNPEALRHIFS